MIVRCIRTVYQDDVPDKQKHIETDLYFVDIIETIKHTTDVKLSGRFGSVVIDKNLIVTIESEDD